LTRSRDFGRVEVQRGRGSKRGARFTGKWTRLPVGCNGSGPAMRVSPFLRGRGEVDTCKPAHAVWRSAQKPASSQPRARLVSPWMASGWTLTKANRPKRAKNPWHASARVAGRTSTRGTDHRVSCARGESESPRIGAQQLKARARVWSFWPARGRSEQVSDGRSTARTYPQERLLIGHADSCGATFPGARRVAHDSPPGGAHCL